MLVSKENKKKFHLEDFSSVVVHGEKKDFYYQVIDVKTNLNDKKRKKKLGWLCHAGSKLNVYFVAESIYDGFNGEPSNNNVYHTYTRKTNESIAYNMGYIYGAGARGIKKRVRDYFEDCPTLVESVEKDIIDKDKIAAIVQFYENNCN